MKKIILMLFLILPVIVSCQTMGGSNPEGANSEGVNMSLNINSTKWYTTLENGFGFVHLHIAGYTDAAIITVQTYGDGVIDDYELEKDTAGNFDQDVIIAFTHAPDNRPLNFTTKVKACDDKDCKETELSSGELKYMD